MIKINDNFELHKKKLMGVLDIQNEYKMIQAKYEQLK